MKDRIWKDNNSNSNSNADTLLTTSAKEKKPGWSENEKQNIKIVEQ